MGSRRSKISRGPTCGSSAGIPDSRDSGVPAWMVELERRGAGGGDGCAGARGSLAAGIDQLGELLRYWCCASGRDGSPELAHGVRLDLANALGGNLVFGGQLVKGRLLLHQPAALDDIAAAVV